MRATVRTTVDAVVKVFSKVLMRYLYRPKA